MPVSVDDSKCVGVGNITKSPNHNSMNDKYEHVPIESDMYDHSEAYENGFSSCCGAAVLMSGFCSKCKEHCDINEELDESVEIEELETPTEKRLHQECEIDTQIAISMAKILYPNLKDLLT